MRDPIVETTAGRIRGRSIDGDVLRFAGVPYAAPTGGAGRFRPPQPRAPWAGIRTADAFAPIAPQHGAHAKPGGAEAMSEDCLALNVWTPSTAGRRPVLVWLHGGGFASGMPHHRPADGTALARTGDVVVVSVAHRLALLGFLHLDELCGGEYAGSGNAGMLDLVAALTWIRDNIAAFGGDPDAVTIHGHSGGGGKVAALCSMPAARGLFRSAAIHGGPPFGFKHAATAHETAEQALALLEIPPTRADRLRDVPLQRLLAVQRDLGVHGAPGPDGMRFAPTVATPELPADPLQAFAAGAASDVALMVGTALDESRAAAFAHPAYLTGDEISDDDLVARVRPGLDDPDDAEGLVAAYRELDPAAGNVDHFFAITSDQFRIRSLRLADAKHLGDGRPSWVYLCETAHDTPHGAFHGIEMPLFFNNTTPATPGRAVASALSAQLVAFAHDELGASETWAPYTPPQPDQLVIEDDALQTARAPRHERVRLWDGIVVTPSTDPWTTLWPQPQEHHSA